MKNEKPIAPFILWECDRKKCECCHDECRHTTDVKHAIDPDSPIFPHLPEGKVEVIPK